MDTLACGLLLGEIYYGQGKYGEASVRYQEAHSSYLIRAGEFKKSRLRANKCLEKYQRTIQRIQERAKDHASLATQQAIKYIEPVGTTETPRDSNATASASKGTISSERKSLDATNIAMESSQHTRLKRHEPETEEKDKQTQVLEGEDPTLINLPGRASPPPAYSSREDFLQSLQSLQ